MGIYLWDPRSQEGGRVLSQRPVIHHVACRLGELVVLHPVSVQLLEQVCDQVVPLPTLLDQGSQLTLKGWEGRHSQVGPRMQDSQGGWMTELRGRASAPCSASHSPALAQPPPCNPSLHPEARASFENKGPHCCPATQGLLTAVWTPSGRVGSVDFS